MPRRTRRPRTRKRRTNRGVALYKIVSFVLICGAIGVALSLFFKIETITVSGNARYTPTQITEASGVDVGDNMFLLNKYDAADAICQALPYVESVQIRRQLPTTMTIHVIECMAPVALQQDGTCYLLGASGKVVDEVSATKIKGMPRLVGIKLDQAMPGMTLGRDLGLQEDEGSKTCDLVLSLLRQLSDKSMLSDTQRIDLSDSKNVTLRYLDRFDVTFPREADVEYKLDYLRAVVERLEVNEKGAIDMTEEGKASFTPA